MKYKYFIYSIISSFISIPLNGQIDSHYWTHQYGAKGLLLNGAVIASTEDETAIFYNPGAMGRGEKFGLSLSFLTPTYSVLSMDNLLGQGTTIRDTEFGFSPGFAAVGFPIFHDDRFKGGATTFTRFKSNLSFRGREVGLVADNEDQLFIGNLDFKKGLTERWFGFGLSYAFSDAFSIGISQFVVLHSESTDLEIQKDIVDANQPDRLLFSSRSGLRYSFNASGGFLTKFGLSWKPVGEEILIGLTITTPTYAYIYKSASFEVNDLQKTSPTSAAVRSNLSSANLISYKTPFSIGYGLDFNYGEWRLSFSAEYFREIPIYTILESIDDPFNGVINSEVFQNKVETGNKEIFNFAIGARKKLLGGSTLILGFRTDFNQRQPIEGFSEFEFLASTPSIYHISLGGLIEILGNEASIGFDFGFGSRKGKQSLVDFSNINSENLFTLSSARDVKTLFRSFVLVMTYDFIFKRRKR